MDKKLPVSIRAGLLAACMVLAPMYSAATNAQDALQEQYQQDIERCNNTPGIDVQACLKEAGAALAAARSNQLSSPAAETEIQNRTQRCEQLPAEQREECLLLMDYANTRVEGSVETGGILRETTIVIPAPVNSPQ